MKHKFFHKLSAYSGSAVAFLFIQQDAKSQVIYTDIDPDIILNEGGQVADIDMNADAIVDFWFHNNSFINSFTTSSGSFVMHLKQNLLVGPEVDGNALAGFSNRISTSFGGYTTRYYPSALFASEVIDTDLEWQEQGLQILALRTFDSLSNIEGFGFSCDWYNLDVIETIDGYVGIRFEDIASETHYGWIRCDVKDEGRTLVIKDYAYETEIGAPILTGDTTHYVSIDETGKLTAVIYSFEKSVYVQTQALNSIISIYDVTGKQVYAGTIEKEVSVINLQNAAAGVYLVELNNEGNRTRKKIFIN